MGHIQPNSIGLTTAQSPKLVLYSNKAKRSNVKIVFCSKSGLGLVLGNMCFRDEISWLLNVAFIYDNFFYWTKQLIVTKFARFKKSLAKLLGLSDNSRI